MEKLGATIGRRMRKGKRGARVEDTEAEDEVERGEGRDLGERGGD